jgi:hypothetical protein
MWNEAAGIVGDWSGRFADADACPLPSNIALLLNAGYGSKKP